MKEDVLFVCAVASKFGCGEVHILHESRAGREFATDIHGVQSRDLQSIMKRFAASLSTHGLLLSSTYGECVSDIDVFCLSFSPFSEIDT